VDVEVRRTTWRGLSGKLVFCFFQWPRKSMDFVKQIREKVETMGFYIKDYYEQIRPSLVKGKVFLKAEIKKKVEEGWRDWHIGWRLPETGSIRST
jgi:hypothetical protein